MLNKLMDAKEDLNRIIKAIDMASDHIKLGNCGMAFTYLDDAELIGEEVLDMIKKSKDSVYTGGCG